MSGVRQFLCFLYLFSFQVQVFGQSVTPCKPNPCLNGGECIVSSSWARGYTCICPESLAGIHCDLPFPDIKCGNKTIEILIDQRVVTEQRLPSDTRYIHFNGAPGCRAVMRNGQYHLKVDAPFVDCDMHLKRDHGSFLFSQQIVWNKVDNVVERPLVLVDFRCNYTDRYSVMAGPVIPTVTTVDFDTSYGRFTVQMDLHKNRTFNGFTKFNARPVVAIDQEVCVQQNLINVMPDDLVLTMLNCWASSNKSGEGVIHNLLANKCVSDPGTFIVANGNASAAQFCFRMFKWRQNMDAIFVHCRVSVCNRTAFPETCSCEGERKKRSVEVVNKPESEEDSTLISSGVIRVVDPSIAEDWDSFLRQGENTNDLQYFDVDGDDLKKNQEIIKKNKKRDTTILIAVGVVLVVAVIMLGVACGVFITCRRSRVRRGTKQSPGSNSSRTGAPISRDSTMPLA